MAEKMRAIVLTKLAQIKTRLLKLMSIDKPTIKGGTGLILEIETCGVCRSNLHLIEGYWKKYGAPSSLPVIPGHEVVGVVKKAGWCSKKRSKQVRGLASSRSLAPGSNVTIVLQGGRT
jgi:alcohol dehydrogenase, propanol-preferring